MGVTVEHAENGSMLILEYSEVPKILADATDEEGKLVYGAGNICNHYVRVDFLINRVLPTLSGIYHLAKKKIPFLDPNGSGKQVLPSANNGYKLEMYVFDIFPLADKWTVLEVNREEEFAPVKNEPGNSVDSPDTARQLLSKQAIRWLHAAGAKVINNNSNASGDINSKNIDTSIITGTGPEPKEVSGGVAREDVYSDLGLVEISPLISYEGEGLEHFLGQVVHAPCFLK